MLNVNIVEVKPLGNLSHLFQSIRPRPPVWQISIPQNQEEMISIGIQEILDYGRKRG